MTIEDVIITRLAGLAAVTALVSQRIHLDRLPQSPKYPCVRVQEITEQKDYHLRGGSRIRTALVQVDAFAEEAAGNPYAAASAVAVAIHGDDAGSGLSGWRGFMGSPALAVLCCLRVDRRRMSDPEVLRVLAISQDYQVTYRI